MRISNQVFTSIVCLGLQALSSKLFEPSLAVSYRLRILDNARELSDGSFCTNKRFLLFCSSSGLVTSF